MRSVSDYLLSFKFMRELEPREVLASAALWSLHTLRAGKVLWSKGHPAHKMALIISGELSVIGDDQFDIGTVGPGEMLGETTIFIPTSLRSATIQARTDAHILVLSREDLLSLREKESAVYAALVEKALETVAQRVRRTDARIARASQGNSEAPARSEPSMLVRMWKVLKPGGLRTHCPELLPLLRRQPVLAAASAPVLQLLARSFASMPVDEGQIICLEGEMGGAAYVVADGEVAVLRHVRGERAELLATLDEGSQFGINTMIDGGLRTASCVANRAGWLYRLDAAAYAKLKREARLLWQEAMVAALDAQIRNANNALQRAIAEREKAEAREGAVEDPASASQRVEVDPLLRASGHLEGLPAIDKKL